MTNPHPATPTVIDIRASADLVIAQLVQGRTAEALRLLDRTRETERPVVQEALDRYVAVGAGAELERLRLTGVLTSADQVRTVDRLAQALRPPRMPEYSHDVDEPNELLGLTRAQKHDVYASMVEARGDQVARDQVRENDRSVLLALRRENSTLASMDGTGRAGTGVYNDHIVVLTRGPDGERGIFISDRANTEPTAQYSHQAGSNGRRQMGNGVETRRIAPREGYEDVRPRKIEGEDVDGDTMLDPGRLAEGTLEMARAEHPNPRYLGTRDAFRPSPEQLAADRVGLVQRDTNGDGYFTGADINGVDALNHTFKIHSGSRSNTDSAGCLTIHPDDYRAFIDAARSNPRQTRWQLVLTSTEGGLFHNVEVGGARAQPQAERHGPEANAPDGDPQANHRPRRGPFADPILDRYYAAVLAGDSAVADRIALEFAQSAEGQRMTRQSDRLLAEQQVQDAQAHRQAPQQQTPSREDAVLQI